MKKLLILGAGGYGKTVADVAAQLGYTAVDFLDDHNPAALAPCADYSRLAGNYDGIYPAFGNNDFRVKWLRLLMAEGIPVPTLVHPRAYVSPRAKLGTGTVVLPMAVVNTNVTVGMGCIINIGALIDHDTVIEDGTHLAPGAIVKAENRIAAGSRIESGQVIENRQYPL